MGFLQASSKLYERLYRPMSKFSKRFHETEFGDRIEVIRDAGQVWLVGRPPHGGATVLKLTPEDAEIVADLLFTMAKRKGREQ